jgi:phage terminase Nu1 subunit (DNA packaging protein)
MPGGYREGAGRKPAGYEHPEGRADFEKERAEHERVKREQRELALAIARGEYVPRAAVRQASATALSILTQAIRSIPDNCERQFSLPPEVVEGMQQQIDSALSEVALAFAAMSPEERA